jgi:O-antigen ligase
MVLVSQALEDQAIAGRENQTSIGFLTGIDVLIFFRKVSLDQIGLTLFLLLAFSIFISKAAVNIIYSLLLLLSIFACTREKFRVRISRNRNAAYFMIPLAAGCFLSLFSMSGIQGPIEFLIRYRFLFLFVPYFLFIPSRKTLLLLLTAMNIGAFVGMVYAAAYTDLTNPFGSVYGFHKFGRHSDMLFSLGLSNMTYFAVKLKSKKNPGIQGRTNVLEETVSFIRSMGKCEWFYGLMGFNTVLILITILFIGQRAAYLGLYFGLTVLLFLYSRRLLILLFLLTLVAPLFMPEYVIERTRTIIDPQMTSNAERIRLLEIGTDFISEKNLFFTGAGVESVEPGLKAFLETKNPEYQKRYGEVLKLYPDNLHSSYLQMAVEAGVVFLIFYMGSLIVLSVKILRTHEFSQTFVLSCAVVLFAGFGLSQLFHEEFFRYGGLVFFLCFYGSCMADSNANPVAQDC